MSRWLALGLVMSALFACSAAPDASTSSRGAASPTQPPPQAAGPHTLTIIGTNDLHGQIARLPILAGFVANVRAARAADGGGVLLLDGGDMFQGTLESNLGEGADVVRAYNAIGYTATAIGNHEFDYGPVGPAATAKDGEDPRGALKARASEPGSRSWSPTSPTRRPARASTSRTCPRRRCSTSRARRSASSACRPRRRRPRRCPRTSWA